MTDPAPLRVSHHLLDRRADQYLVLRDWVASLARPESNLLDIGAGDGDDDYTTLLRPLVARMVGVDPAGAEGANPALDECHVESVESFAGHSTERFELAVAVYVVEHVPEPESFLRASRACLRPGGSLLLVTPNLWHYFGLVAKAATALGAERRLLALTRAKHPRHAHVAHFPVAYKMNSVRAMARLGARAGFGDLEVRHLENPSVFETYFPERLAPLPRLYSSAVHALSVPGTFGTLICRLGNPPA